MRHLQFYEKHSISPVRYDDSDLTAHLQRREALYRSLGVLPGLIHGARVLEVAAGSGQNSLYVASQFPRELVLVEPNAVGFDEITALYESPAIDCASPEVHRLKLEDFQDDEPFDLVLCENWLGALEHERGLLRKLVGMVAPGGVLVVTAISPAGLIPNLLRRALAAKLVHPGRSFEERTQELIAAFTSHLATIGSMTRTPTHWVQDNLINPAYFDLSLTLDLLIRTAGDELQVVGTNPQFREDWRWFKSMFGSEREYNEHCRENYLRRTQYFFDYRIDPSVDELAAHPRLDALGERLNGAVRALEQDLSSDAGSATAEAELLALVGDIADELEGRPLRAQQGVLEVGSLLARQAIVAQDVADMDSFRGLFGRETFYVSMQRPIF